LLTLACRRLARRVTAEVAQDADTLREVITDDAVDDLAVHLFGVDFGAKTTREVTSEITRRIVDWALARGWTARTEARVEVAATQAAARLGYVDVLITGEGGAVRLAIEIDSADKPWSLDKLRHAAAAGMRPIWVRWGDEDWAFGHLDVDVIQLPAPRRPASGRDDPQLGIWP